MHLKRKKKGFFGSAPSYPKNTGAGNSAPINSTYTAPAVKPVSSTTVARPTPDARPVNPSVAARPAPETRPANPSVAARPAPEARPANSPAAARPTPEARPANSPAAARPTPEARPANSTTIRRSVPAVSTTTKRRESPEKKASKARTVFKWVGRVAAVLGTAVFMIAATLVVSIMLICSDISPAAKSTFVTTMLETGELKFLANLFVPADEIQKIVDANTMGSLDAEVDSSLISIGGGGHISGDEGSENTDPIEVIEISGRTFYGTLLIVKDPSRISLSTIYPWKNTGSTLDELVENAGAVAGINGGLYNSGGNSGGRPYGIVVAGGEVLLNEPQSWPGLVIIGFDEDNILQIIPVGDMNEADIVNLVKERRIRDAVTFQEEASDKNNHFVQLIINGEERELNGAGSGLNPRTCIGQRADGAVLMLVTDGRGKSGHLGASASDLIGVMSEYGAVNAANLDGGSSSCMYYEGEYLMDSVTFYQANSSWKMPLAFVISKE